MRFAEGQTIVHPHHGPATVRATKTRLLRNTQRGYVLLEVHDTNPTVGVPVDSADAVGLRPVLDGAMASHLAEFSFLQETDQRRPVLNEKRPPLTWFLRYCMMARTSIFNGTRTRAAPGRQARRVR